MGIVSLTIFELYLQNNPTKICNARNHIYGENFKLKFCMCAQSMGDWQGLPQQQ